MLEQVYASYRKKADEIDWKDMNQNDLFYEYIKHENDPLSEVYFAAIVCRFWGYAGRVYLQCNRHVTFEECYDCVIDTIKYVLKKRVWENPSSSLYGDYTAPDKAFHISLKRQRSIMLSKFNAFRRRSNFNVLSLDGAHEEFSDAADGLLFNMDSSEIDRTRIYISEYFERGDAFSGLLLDIICYNNYEKYDERIIIRGLRDINMDYYNYYEEYYGVSKEEFKEALKNIKGYSNKMLKVKIKSLLYSIKKEIMLND